MTYRVIGENGAYIIQRQDSDQAHWFLVSDPYQDVTEALTAMHKLADQRRAERQALSGEATVHGDVTV